MTAFWDVALSLMMGAVHTSETSISMRLHSVTSQKAVIFIQQRHVTAEKNDPGEGFMGLAALFPCHHLTSQMT
jgi:hypothetical protein